MNGKSYSLSLGMLFKKYHCAKCGSVLKTEQTHRIVTKDDKDYFEFHDARKFPQRDYDVYGQQFKCPLCNSRITYDEQCIIARIQKQQGYHVLAGSEIKTYYKACKERHIRSRLISSIVFAVLFALLGGFLFYFTNAEKTTATLLQTGIFFLIFCVVSVVSVIRSHQGYTTHTTRRGHSYETKMLLEKLHTCCTNNRQTIAVSNRCYCFHCKASMDHGEITDYLEDGQTARCPHCGVDAIIPDGVDASINDDIIAQMHDYWF